MSELISKSTLNEIRQGLEYVINQGWLYNVTDAWDVYQVSVANNALLLSTYIRTCDIDDFNTWCLDTESF